MTSRIERLIATMYDHEELWDNSSFCVEVPRAPFQTGDVCFMAALAYPELLSCHPAVGLRQVGKEKETHFSASVFAEFFGLSEEQSEALVYGHAYKDVPSVDESVFEKLTVTEMVRRIREVVSC